MIRRPIQLWLIAAALATVWSSVALGAFTAEAAAPSNDNFASAIVLTGATVTRSADTNAGATLQPGEDPAVAGAAGGASVWYTWTAPLEGEVEIDTVGSDFDTLLGVYTGNAVGSLTEVASNDDFTHPPASRVRFHGTLGAVYRIRIDGFQAATGSIHLLVHQALPPVNDDFADAILLSLQDATRTGDTNDGATLETDEADSVAGADAGASVWYVWTAPVTGDVALDTATSTFDTLVGVYTGTAVDTLTEVASNDDAKLPPTSLVRFSATSGTVYRIRVDGFAATTGAVNLHLHESLPAPTPANDDFANAIALSGMTASRGGDTNAGATLEGGESPMVAGEAASGSVWYTWTAPATGTVTVDTATSDFDTLLALYTGNAVNALTVLGSHDDVSGGLTSKVRVQVTASTVYRIRVDGYAGDSGTIALHLDEVLPPANDSFANAYILSGSNVSRTSDTNAGATLEAGEATTVAAQPAANSIWYSWTASQSTAVVIDTASSGVDTLLGAYTGASVGALTEVASNDDVGVSSHTSKVAFPVIAGTVYRVRVDSAFGDTGSVNLHVALATVSDVPTNVIAAPGAGQATVAWTPPADDGGSPITGYDVTAYVGGVPQGTTHVGAVAEATVAGLSNGTTYTFRVAAINIVGTGPLSVVSNPVTPRTVPDAPTSPSATPGPAQATINWTAPAFNGGSPITGYSVTRYVGGVAQGTSNVGVVSQATISGLTNGTTYTFRVAAKNEAGTGALSSDTNAVTPRTVPDAPTAVSAAPGSKQATVTWSAPASDGASPISGYDVTTYVGGVAQGTTTVGVVTQTTVGGLTNGTTYTFKVAAKNAIGTGAQSVQSSPVTPRNTPDAPTNVVATVGGAGQTTVNWTAPVFDGGSAITGYDVTSYAGGLAKGKISVGVVTQATFGGLTNGTAYTFRVTAKNVAGAGVESVDSNVVTPTVPKVTLTVAKSGSGAGTVTSGGAIDCGATCTGDFDGGSSLALTAVPSSGSTFAGWSGPCTGIGSCTVWFDTGKTVTAKFDQVQTQQRTPKQSPQCVVPNVKRKPLATAKKRIAAAHCKTGKITKAQSATVPKGRVISQRLKAGKKLAAGTKVNLVVSRGKR